MRGFVYNGRRFQTKDSIFRRNHFTVENRLYHIEKITYREYRSIIKRPLIWRAILELRGKDPWGSSQLERVTELKSSANGIGERGMARFMPILLLIFSNIFMTYAWYGHLKDLRAKPLVIVIVISWSVAFFEYCLQVPANRLGSSFFSLSQLKVIQEIITMIVFAGFCAFYMKERLTWDYLWASLCLAGAAYFMFRQLSVK